MPARARHGSKPKTKKEEFIQDRFSSVRRSEDQYRMPSLNGPKLVPRTSMALQRFLRRRSPEFRSAYLADLDLRANEADQIRRQASFGVSAWPTITSFGWW